MIVFYYVNSVRARKQAERAALAAEEEAKNAALSNKTSRFGGRKFGTSNSPPPGDDDTVTSRNPEAIGSPRSQRLVGGIRVASGAGNELAAAMAKRRARAEQ